MKLICKWTIPVDDQQHIVGGGPVTHIDSQFGKSDEIQIWTEELAEFNSRRSVQVVGTGQNYHDEGVPLGSVVVAGGHLVWHVVQFPFDGEDHHE